MYFVFKIRLHSIHRHRRILLDAGDADKPSYIEHLKGVLRSENASIETILLTHWHHDHIGGVGDVLRAIDGIRGGFFFLSRAFAVCGNTNIVYMCFTLFI